MRFIHAALVAVLFAIWPPGSTKADDILRAVSTHWLDYSGTAIATTQPIGGFTRIVDLTCTTNCYVAFAISGSATSVAIDQSTSHYLPADVTKRFSVSPNTTMAVIRVTADGILTVQEMSK